MPGDIYLLDTYSAQRKSCVIMKGKVLEKGEHTLDQKSYELLQTSIVQGADGLGQYLKKILSKPILLVTGNGREFYPERIPVAESIRKILCHMPSFQDEQYYYTQTSHT